MVTILDSLTKSLNQSDAVSDNSVAPGLTEFLKEKKQLSSKEYLLIDGDHLVYSTAHRTHATIEDAKKDIFEVLLSILTRHKIYRFIGVLGYQSNYNFRFKIDPLYKSDRPELEPAFKKKLGLLKGYLRAIGFHYVRGIETDDCLTICHTYLNDNSTHNILCHNDKDYNQTSGTKYDMFHDRLYVVNEEEAVINFTIQLAMGDRADNIDGLKGIGATRAGHLVRNTEFPYGDVLEKYIKQLGQIKGIREYFKNYQLLHLLTANEASIDNDIITLLTREFTNDLRFEGESGYIITVNYDPYNTQNQATFEFNS